MKISAFQKRWNEKYDLLVEYKQEHGHCNVPTNVVINGQKLRSWVYNQRTSYKNGTLPGDRLVRLNEIGFNWSVLDVSWEEQFKQLEEFKGKHGHFRVPQRDVIDGQKVGCWLARQRQWYKKGILPHDRVSRLNAIGFNWSAFDASWEGRCKQLEEFKGEHGHCNVPQRYPDDPSFGHWVVGQRRFYRVKKLRKDRIDSLNELGFTWEVPRGYAASVIGRKRTMGERFTVKSTKGRRLSR